MIQRWLPLKRAAAYAGLSPNTLRKYADEGLIRARRTEGGHRRFDRESIDEFYNRQEVDELAIRKALGL